MSISMNECVGCWTELLGLLLSLWPFSFCHWVLSMSLVLSVVLKTSNVLRLNESRPLMDFLFIIMFCFTRSVMMSAKASLVILEAVVLVMKSNIESTSGRLWLMLFKWSKASNIFGLKWDILILAFISEWVIASF